MSYGCQPGIREMGEHGQRHITGLRVLPGAEKTETSLGAQDHHRLQGVSGPGGVRLVPRLQDRPVLFGKGAVRLRVIVHKRPPLHRVQASLAAGTSPPSGKSIAIPSPGCPWETLYTHGDAIVKV